MNVLTSQAYLAIALRSSKLHWLSAFLFVLIFHALIFWPLMEEPPVIEQSSQMNAIPIVMTTVLAAQIRDTHTELTQQQTKQVRQRQSVSSPSHTATSLIKLPEDKTGEFQGAQQTEIDKPHGKKQNTSEIKKSAVKEQTDAKPDSLTEETDIPELVDDAEPRNEINLAQEEVSKELADDMQLNQASDIPEIADQMSAPAMTYSAQQIAAAKASWQSQLMSYLAKEKKYPRLSRKKREQGTVVIHFIMNRIGEVLSAEVTQATPFKALNKEALSLVKRASPLPAPPEEFSGEQIELAVPIEFYIY